MKIFVFIFLAVYIHSYGQSTISTYAGTSAGFSGDGGVASSAKINQATGVAFDTAGDLLIADVLNKRIRSVNNQSIISTIAGTGIFGYAGDGGPATSCQFRTPTVLASDALGNIFIVDEANMVVRKINAAGIITTIAGSGMPGYSGDGGRADTAKLNHPLGIAFDYTSGSLYIADASNHVIRKVNASGIISTVAGNGTPGFSGDGASALTAQLNDPQGIAVDPAGNLYIGDTGNNRIRKVNTSGVIFTIAGTGNAGYAGDGASAASADLNGPCGLELDNSGNLFVADYFNHVVRKIDLNNLISTIAGNGVSGISGDGGPATSAQLYFPNDIVLNSVGDLFIADSGNSRIRKVTNIGVMEVKSMAQDEPMFSIYPNPNQGRFSIITKRKYDRITVDVFNVYGERITNKSFIAKNCSTAQIENLSEGVYFIELIIDGIHNKTKRIIVTQ